MSNGFASLDGLELTMSDLFVGDCNELGQLGTGSLEQVNLPIEIFADKDIKCVRCGSESTMVLDAGGESYCHTILKTRP